jgi:serine protease Do
MWSSKTKRWSAAGLIFIGIVIGVVFTSNLDWTPKGFATRSDDPFVLESQQAPSKALLNLQDTGKAFTEVSKVILPTVVGISTSKIVKQSQGDNEFWGPILRDFFGREFRDREPQEQRLQGLGSGVIVSRDGYILTNHHVISNADDIKVNLYDKRTFEAELVGTDPLTEVAVIKVNGENLPAARLGDSDDIEIGEWVLAVGNPLQLYSTVTAGIISALSRNINIIQDENADQLGSYAIENFIQTDAAINRGNSGGALVNLKAEVIGINTAIATGTGFYAGYGFAIPINLAKKIMTDLINKGYVVRAWLGISMQAVDELAAERFGMDRPRGVRIVQVVEDSPAEKGGLKEMDVILELDGEEVSQSNQIQNEIALKNPGDVVTLKILRNRREREIKVKLGQRETGRETAQTREDEEEFPTVGLKVQTLNNSILSRLDHDYYDNDEGVIVTDVERYSVAFDAGIGPGDLIYQIEDTPIGSTSDYTKAMRGFDKGQVVIFYVKRGRNTFHAFLKIPK